MRKLYFILRWEYCAYKIVVMILKSPLQNQKNLNCNEIKCLTISQTNNVTILGRQGSIPTNCVGLVIVGIDVSISNCMRV